MKRRTGYVVLVNVNEIMELAALGKLEWKLARGSIHGWVCLFKGSQMFFVVLSAELAAYVVPIGDY
jgi:hypothetical protein